MLREVVAFSQDENADWVAELSCGHTQHVRHRPPFDRRDWVTTEAGRQSKLGAPFECNFCDMPALPHDARVYKQTEEFDEYSVPSSLLSEHRTRANTWGRIVVVEGLVKYEIMEPQLRSWILRPGVLGVIAPATWHRVEPCGHSRFRLEFLRRP